MLRHDRSRWNYVPLRVFDFQRDRSNTKLERCCRDKTQNEPNLLGPPQHMLVFGFRNDTVTPSEHGEKI